MDESHSPDPRDGFDFATVVGCDPGASLLVQCAEVVGLIAAVNAGDGPYNRAEAVHLSEAEKEIALFEQRAIFQHIECVSQRIAETAVSSESIETAMREVTAKITVLDALSSIESWDREDLVALRISINRDQAQIQRRLVPNRRRAPRASRIGRLTSVW